MDVDVYDFDKTVFPWDSGSLFWGYCIVHHPQTLILAPYQVYGLLKYAVGKIDLAEMKNYVFSFVELIPVDKAVKKFWDKYEKYVYPWAWKEKRERFSVIVSASPDFLMDEIGKRLGFDAVISTRHDARGRVVGLNCHDKEKVRRFRESFPDARVINVYSDSMKHDVPIFSMGKKCFHAVKGSLIPFKLKKD